MGHAQKVCRKRLNAGAPCVDKEGKPYANQTGIKAVQETSPTTSTASTAAISTLFPQDPYSLNW
jgi:hypothetical protein